VDKTWLETKNPDLRLSNLMICVHGREFPDNKDYWDGNWLYVTIICGDNSSEVNIYGPYMRSDEFLELKNILITLDNSTEVSSLEFGTMEPYLSITFKNSLINKEMEINIKNDTTVRPQTFIFKLSNEQLVSGIEQIDKILQLYPIIGTP
jgi:hypothetical protein